MEIFTTSCQISYYVTISLVDVFDKGKVSYFLSYLALKITSKMEWYATTLLSYSYYVYNTRLLLVISRTNDKFRKGTVCYYLSCLYYATVFLIDQFDKKKGLLLFFTHTFELGLFTSKNAMFLFFYMLAFLLSE